MAWPTRLVLVRHAESAGNVRTAEERAALEISSDKYPLTPLGERQAAITGAYLHEKYPLFDVHYVSYYLRSRQTMQIMFPNVRVYEDPRLAEANRGIWHTMTRDEIQTHFPREIARKEREGLYHYRPFGGENWPDIELRIHSFLGTLNRDCEGMSVAMVVHGHWLILLQRLIDHFSVEEALCRYERGAANNASVTVYEGRMVKNKSRLVLVEENVTPWQGQV